MSSDWSFGSRSRPCGQSRKVSMGTMVDPLLNKGYESSRKYDMGAMAIPRGNSKLGSDAERIEVTDEGKKTNLQKEEGSPWVTPRSNCKNSVISEGNSKIKIDRRSKHKTDTKLKKLKDPSPDKSVKFFPHNGKGCDGKKNDGEANQRLDAVEKSFSAFEKGVFMPDKVPPGDNTGNTVNQLSENLRMNLCELMGSVFSPDKDQTSSPPADEAFDFLQPEPNVDQAEGASVQPKHNSDTIECDSESHCCSKRRAVTRSKMKKRAQKNASPEKVERGHLNAHKDKLKERNAYLFKEGCEVVARQSDAPKKSSSILQYKNRIPTTTTESKETTTKSKETDKKCPFAEPRRISLPLEENENKLQPAASRKENSFSAGRSSPRGVRPQNSPSLSLHRVGENVRPSTIMTEKHPLEQLLEKNLDGGEDINITKLAEDIACGNHRVNTSTVKDTADQQDYFVSPTLGRRSPGMSSSPSSSSKDNRTKQGNPSVAEAMFNLERMFTSRNFTPKETWSQPREGPDMENDGSDSQYTDASDSDSSDFLSDGELDCSGKDPGKEETLSPEVVTVKKPKPMLHMPKRLRSLRGTKPYDGQPVSHSSKGKDFVGTRTAKKQDSGEFHVLDEFTRAIGPLAMSLEKIKIKMKSVAANKSSEILNSLAAKIQTQMRSVESQIQSDVGKLKSFSKQKRKFLEREFQEQEQQLKLIHERFKKELNQNVQRCIETTEGLEENKIELKKILEKQKASHRKLLMQVEQAAQTEIQDAEKRISNMNKLAREQVIQLRLLIEQYLGEGNLS